MLRNPIVCRCATITRGTSSAIQILKLPVLVSCDGLLLRITSQPDLKNPFELPTSSILALGVIVLSLSAFVSLNTSDVEEVYAFSLKSHLESRMDFRDFSDPNFFRNDLLRLVLANLALLVELDFPVRAARSVETVEP